MIEPQNIIDLGASPSVNRLIVIADAADVFLRCRLCTDVRRTLFTLSPCGRGCPSGGEAERGRVRGSRSRLVPTPHPARLRFAQARHPLPQGERVSCARLRRLRLRQQPQPQILRHVGVLIFVHQDELEALLVLPQHVRVLPEQPDVLQQQVAEVGGVERLQPLLIGERRASCPCRWRSWRLRRPAPGRASARGFSSRRASWRTPEQAIFSRRASRLLGAF